MSTVPSVLNTGHKMDIRVGDVLKLKKKHPCGANDWLTLRIGADFKLKCLSCGHEIMSPRSSIEKNLISVLPRCEAPL